MPSRKSINQTILAGRVGKNIDRKTIKFEDTPEPKTVINFSLCTQEIVNLDGVAEEDWHNISFYGKLAERLSAVIEPGIMLHVNGRTRNRTYRDDKQNKKFGSTVVGKEFTVLGVPAAD